jgi:hypothetical protein
MSVPAIALALAASSVGAQTPAEPLEMEPSSSWVADYADDSCALIRDFHAGDDKVTLQLRQFGPGEKFEVSVVSRTLSRTSQAPRVRFEPDESFFEPSSSFFLDKGDLHGVQYVDSLRPATLKPPGELEPDWPESERQARERTITGLSVAASFERDLVLRTGRMDRPISAIRTCLDDLLTQLGVDPALQRMLSRQPKPIDLRRWSQKVQEAYPIDMVRAGRNALVHIRLIVGADGKPVSCIPDNHSAETSFGESACQTSMRYARFEPALDANGAPVASLYTTMLVYQLL